MRPFRAETAWAGGFAGPKGAPRRATGLLWPAWLAALAVAGLVLGTLAAVAWEAGGFGWPRAADWRAIRFTLWQAALSATLSALLAVPVARALARRRFPGRGALVTLLGAPFLLPSIVAIMGLVAIFGRNGMLNTGLAALGLPTISIYGPQGVITAHVFFNLPLATRLLLHGWQAVPAERFRLAAALGFGARDLARHIERPMLRALLPGVWLAIFLICLTSFAVALALGGGPRATTIELAIYQAFRFDFDLARAAGLALVQVVVCMLALCVSLVVAVPAAFGPGLDRARADRVPGITPPGLLPRLADAAAILAATAFLILPLGAVILRGLPALGGLPPSVWEAAGRSLAIALAATLVSTAAALALSLAAARAPAQARWLEGAGLLPLIASPLMLGTGLFLLLRPFTAPMGLALPVTVVVNAAMALPFMMRALLPAARNVEADYGRLAASLGLAGRARLRWLVLPRLAAPLGFAAGLSAALSMGDLGVIALFGSPGSATLPLQLYQLMGSYRLDDAAGAAVLLLGLSLALFALFDRLGRHNART